MYNL
jgi:hypothetical protein